MVKITHDDHESVSNSSNSKSDTLNSDDNQPFTYLSDKRQGEVNKNGHLANVPENPENNEQNTGNSVKFYT